jgi:hypothetical protein
MSIYTKKREVVKTKAEWEDLRLEKFAKMARDWQEKKNNKRSPKSMSQDQDEELEVKVVGVNEDEDEIDDNIKALEESK